MGAIKNRLKPKKSYATLAEAQEDARFAAEWEKLPIPIRELDHSVMLAVEPESVGTAMEAATNSRILKQNKKPDTMPGFFIGLSFKMDLLFKV